MRLGIDASNISTGGGLTHVVELLNALEPGRAGIGSVSVWGRRQTLEQFPGKPGLDLLTDRALEGSLAGRIRWQRTRLHRLAAGRCDVLFVPGGTYGGPFRPFVTVAGNLLPFEPQEAARYGFSRIRARLLLLRVAQTHTFRRAAGMIYLTRHTRQVVERRIGPLSCPRAVIPLGKAESFCQPPRWPEPISTARPLRCLYVSIVDTYKHQWHVARAVAALRAAGSPIELDLVGPAYPPALARLRQTLAEVDPQGGFIRYHGPVSYAELPRWYGRADVFVFASSCETFGQILVEAMASGLPIACSKRSALPEVLDDAGLYFDPEQPVEIADALRRFLDSPDLRQRCAQAAFERARQFSWQRCARETIEFLRQVVQDAGVVGAGAPRTHGSLRK